MKCCLRKVRWVSMAVVAFAAAGQVGGQDVVINELMYHPLQPAFGAEPVGEEFIELFNRGTNVVSLNGWRFDKGVSFTFPNVTLESGAYLVVAADRTVFAAKYPGVTNVVGGWDGTLGNNGETVRLVNAAGDTMDSVAYGTEGDWATRQRSASDVGQRGWIWNCPADGLGRSMELRNPFLGNNNGQNWTPSGLAGGTPGRVNSGFTTNIAPLILDLAHSPLVPQSSEPVAITVRIVDESAAGLAVSVFWRVDANPQSSPFNTAAMFDDGAHGDGAAGDGIYGVLLPAQPNNTVVEFYVQAVDDGGRTNTWPRPAIAAVDGTGPTGQVVNALYQVDDNPQNAFGVVSASQPVYKLIMTEAERVQLAGIPCSGSQNSDAEMNGTFISLDGTGVECRYRCGFRNRGHGSRCATPPNYRVDVPNDDRWKGQRGINLNTVNTPAQTLGAIIAQKAGLAGANSRAAQVRVNNANRAATGTGMLGAYAANEEPNAEWASEHFPLDSAGNVYRAIRDIAPPDFVWRGTNFASYTNTYFKGDNSSAYDFSDIVQLHRIVGTNDLFTTANVRQVANPEQWCVYFAVMSLFGNNETSANTGYNDDYFLYRGVNDPRFILLYYDNDTILSDSLFGARSTSDGIFSAEANNGMGVMTTRFLEWPDFKPIYYATMQRLLNTTFSPAEFNAIVDEALSVYPPGSSVNSVANGVKTYMNARRATVQSLINGLVPPATNNPVATVSGEPRSPTPFTTATLTVGGNGITHYKFKLNNGAFSAETPVGTPLALSALPDGSTNTVYVVGRNSAGIYQASPTSSKTWVVQTSLPAVRLNEVLARNAAAVNHNGTFPDMVELYNEGAALADLSGLRLTDDPADPNKFTFPPGTTLDVGNYLVVFANNDDGTPGLHLGFALNQDGDAVYLYDSIARGGAVLDSVQFGLQVPDLSIGRFGSTGDWLLCQPTLGAANAAQPLGDATGLHINEWLTSGTLPLVDDFIELYNPDALPIALGGLYLTDQPIGAPALHRIADRSFISGRGFVTFIADGNADAGANHLGFQLSAELGQIGLNGPDLSRIDWVSYPPQVTGVAQGRCPDGNTKFVFLSFPTPGSPNACPTTPPAPLLANILPLTNVWKYNQNGVNLGTTWKEVSYDDSTWPAGPALLGQLRSGGSVPETIRTALQISNVKTSFYFRTHFTLNPGSNFASLQISNVVDDGAVFYVNGSEAGRFNMPGGTVTFGTLASANITDSSWNGPLTVPSGLVHAGDNVLAVEVHQATATSADVMFGLRLDGVIATSTAAAAGVVLNEVLANNATLVELDGTTPDWVELYNPSTNAVDLGGMSLSDSTLTPRRWVFPAPTLLPPQNYLVVRFDANAPPSTTNTGFGLSATGDSVYLFNGDLTVQDRISFGLQAADFSIGRVPSGGSNWVLTLPSAGVSNTVALLGDPGHLKVNEWMAAPVSGDDWFEIYNPDGQPVALAGLGLSDDLSSSVSRMKTRIPALSFMGALTNGYQRFHADKNLAAGADHVDFKLDGALGDEVGISATNGTLIDGVHFGPQQTGVSEGRLPDGTTNVVRFPDSASPGDANYLPLTNVVISEALAHTDLPLEDAIEVQNVSGVPLDLGGWYLSDSKNNLRKYLIPAGPSLPPGGFQVFYEYQFNSPDFPAVAFALSSSKGDQVYLSQAVNGDLTGYRAEVKFGPSINGVSFGRYQTTVGVDFVAMSALSFGTPVTAQSPTNQITLFRTGQGATNPYPQVGPVVLSQIMYHPPDIVEGGVTNDNVVEEFIELRNISSQTLPLYDPAHPTNGWRLRDGVDFHFGAGHSLPPGGYLQVVSFDPVTNLTALASFRSRYGSNSILVGPYSGKLDNGGESLELARPDTPQANGFVPYVLVERVVYSDRAPWPTNADGYGASLLRVSATGYGNDPTNWIASLPTLGSPGITDSDRDGMPDDWETQYGFDKNNPADAAQDADGDGMTNLQEYLSGTDPRDPLSYLRLTCSGVNAGQAVLQFVAVAGKTYTVQYRVLAESGAWQKLADVGAQSATQVVTLLDPSASTDGQRFYRLVTPAQP